MTQQHKHNHTHEDDGSAEDTEDGAESSRALCVDFFDVVGKVVTETVNFCLSGNVHNFLQLSRQVVQLSRRARWGRDKLGQGCSDLVNVSNDTIRACFDVIQKPD